MVNFRQGAIRLIWGIPLTAALMSGLILALAYLKARTLSSFPGVDELWLPNLIFIGTALGGSIGIRIAYLSWRQTIVAALLAGVGLIGFSRFTFSPLFSGPGAYTSVGELTLTVLFFLIVFAAGVFLLPVFDPAVRKTGPAPSLWKIVLGSFCLAVLMISAGIVDFSSFVGVWFVGIFPAMVALIGLISSLLPDMTNVGAWLGGLAVLLPLFILAISLLGYPF